MNKSSSSGSVFLLLSLFVALSESFPKYDLEEGNKEEGAKDMSLGCIDASGKMLLYQDTDEEIFQCYMFCMDQCEKLELKTSKCSEICTSYNQYPIPIKPIDSYMLSAFAAKIDFQND